MSEKDALFLTSNLRTKNETVGLLLASMLTITSDQAHTPGVC